MEPLPLPPPPPGGPGAAWRGDPTEAGPDDDRARGRAPRPPKPPRPGQVSPGWRAVFVVGWGGVVLGLGAVVKTSRTLGLSTWWLGPVAEPRLILLQALPFVVAGVTIVLGFRNVRFLPVIGVVAALALGAIAAGDIGRFDRLAALELVNAAIGLLVSVAAFAGLLGRAAPDELPVAGVGLPAPGVPPTP